MSVIPKQHFLVHYATYCEFSGPPLKSHVATKEMKGNFLKRYAHVVCNFRNIAFTLSMKLQLAAMVSLDSSSVRLSSRVIVQKCVVLTVGSLPCSEKICSALGLSLSSEVTYASSVSICGQTYDSEQVVAIDHSADNDLEFGKVVGSVISSNSKEVFFIVQLFRTLSFSWHHWAYLVEATDSFDLICSEHLADFHPLDLYHSTQSGVWYVSPRYMILP